jgi:hypothetical protein
MSVAVEETVRRTNVKQIPAPSIVTLNAAGEYISLGYFEQEDLRAVLKYLTGTGTVSHIGDEFVPSLCSVCSFLQVCGAEAWERPLL